MADENDLVTVFRSADADAEDQANEICDRLIDAGIDADIFGDDAPGVPVGVFEVRVPGFDVQRAESIINTAGDTGIVDSSHAMDLETVFASDAHNAEMQALEVRALLDANEIPSVLVGASPFPNLPIQVQVPRNYLEEARRVIRDARDAGPTAAEEAERLLENSEKTYPEPQ